MWLLWFSFVVFCLCHSLSSLHLVRSFLCVDNPFEWWRRLFFTYDLVGDLKHFCVCPQHTHTIICGFDVKEHIETYIETVTSAIDIARYIQNYMRARLQVNVCCVWVFTFMMMKMRINYLVHWLLSYEHSTVQPNKSQIHVFWFHFALKMFSRSRSMDIRCVRVVCVLFFHSSRHSKWFWIDKIWRWNDDWSVNYAWNLSKMGDKFIPRRNLWNTSTSSACTRETNIISHIALIDMIFNCEICGWMFKRLFQTHKWNERKQSTDGSRVEGKNSVRAIEKMKRNRIISSTLKVLSVWLNKQSLVEPKIFMVPETRVARHVLFARTISSTISPSCFTLNSNKITFQFLNRLKSKIILW